jgi:hypothetical protein
MVRRWLVSILAIVLIAFTPMSPGLAQPAPTDLTDAQFQQSDQLRTQAFTATNEGNFAKAEQYWTR